jgi:hypothetical protein
MNDEDQWQLCEQRSAVLPDRDIPPGLTALSPF